MLEYNAFFAIVVGPMIYKKVTVLKKYNVDNKNNDMILMILINDCDNLNQYIVLQKQNYANTNTLSTSLFYVVK